MVALACGLHRKGHVVRVLTFYPGGTFSKDLAEAGVPHIPLGKMGRWDLLNPVLRLRQMINVNRTEILHGYMPTGNLLALISSWFGSKVRVVWGIRASNLDMAPYGHFANLLVKLEARLARLPDLIISNSARGCRDAKARGFPLSRIEVISNGIDAQKYFFAFDQGLALRREWGIQPESRLVGLVGRLDPVKGHQQFLEAAEDLAGRRSDLEFACIGTGTPSDLAKMRSLPSATSLGSRLHWIEGQTEMAAVYSALDVLVSASTSEGFSNVIAEAMACELPCVVTDVGDSSRIVGEFGVVVPPKNPMALANGIEHLLSKNRAEIGGASRAWIQEKFSVDALVSRTETVLNHCLGRGQG